MSAASEAYARARKSALAETARREEAGLDPTLPVLDPYLKNFQVVSRQVLREYEIQVSNIVGTVHASRTEAFAFNFMPLLAENSEFAAKWMNLYTSAMEEGLRDPITVYEVYGRFFVEEGNKRVSVTKALGNPLIRARITELILDPKGMEDGDLYEAYLQFRKLTGISTLLMSRKRNYRKLLKLLDVSESHPLSAQRRDDLLALYAQFEGIFVQRAPERTKATASDAFLLFLEVFGSDVSRVQTHAEMEKEFDVLLPAIELYPHGLKAALLTASDVSERKPILSFLSEPVKAALIQPGDPQNSVWARAHEEAFEKMARTLGDKVIIRIWNDVNTAYEIEDALSEAVSWGANVVFTSHPIELPETNAFAARYPQIKFLNCSLNPENTAVRSYYTRGYEIQYLQGMAAGALSTSGRLGYIADYPIFGAIADINAFALGARAVRSDAKVYLDWSTTHSATNREFPMDIDLIFIGGQDFDLRSRSGRQFGLFDVRSGQFCKISSVAQKWDVFYTRIIYSILNRTYRSDEIHHNTPSINYWLGLSNGLMDIQFSDHLPLQTRRLISQIRDDIADQRFFVFEDLACVPSERDRLQSLSMEEIAHMDWFVDGVIGYLPDEDNLMPEAEKLVTLHGLDLEEADSSESKAQAHPEAAENREDVQNPDRSNDARKSSLQESPDRS